MDRHDKLVKLLKESSREPEGVIVYAADGRAFFLTKDDAGRTAIEQDKLFSAFQALQRQGGPSLNAPAKPRRRDPCADTWHWLETHKPNTALWRLRCLTYFEVC